MRDQQTEDRVGLCASCANVQLVPSTRGATFYLCKLSSIDPRFSRYPRLPVVTCPGYRCHERDPGS